MSKPAYGPRIREHQLPKLNVVGSIPIARSNLSFRNNRDLGGLGSWRAALKGLHDTTLIQQPL